MRLLRLKQVVAATGLSRMTIYRLEKLGNFPSRRRLSVNSVAWQEDEVTEWLRTRPPVARRIGRSIVDLAAPHDTNA